MSFHIAAISVIDYVALPLPETHHMPNVYQLIYLSRLAEAASPACVAEIVRVARQRNLASHINSLLVFDGWRFCQTLEGEYAAVCDLADRIRMDERHTRFRVLYRAESAEEKLFGRSSLDYALSYDDGLSCLEAACGPETLVLLSGLLPRLDREPSPSDL
jgi:Sensors of blue-light using FAD